MPPTEPVVITADAVTRFAQALGLDDDGTVPPTFLISLTLPAAERLIDDPDFGLDWSRVLHREQRFAYHRELRAGEAVTCASTIESIKSVAGNDLLALRTDVAVVEDGTVGDGPAAEVWTTLFVAGDTA
ncbi:MAG TPA: MaoC family dehydratase N-terminal domain-containing protein [Glycomyces sp.]